MTTAQIVSAIKHWWKFTLQIFRRQMNPGGDTHTRLRDKQENMWDTSRPRIPGGTLPFSILLSRPLLPKLQIFRVNALIPAAGGDNRTCSCAHSERYFRTLSQKATPLWHGLRKGLCAHLKHWGMNFQGSSLKNTGSMLAAVSGIYWLYSAPGNKKGQD